MKPAHQYIYYSMIFRMPHRKYKQETHTDSLCFPSVCLSVRITLIFPLKLTSLVSKCCHKIKLQCKCIQNVMAIYVVYIDWLRVISRESKLRAIYVYLEPGKAGKYVYLLLNKKGNCRKRTLCMFITTKSRLCNFNFINSIYLESVSLRLNKVLNIQFEHHYFDRCFIGNLSQLFTV